MNTSQSSTRRAAARRAAAIDTARRIERAAAARLGKSFFTFSLFGFRVEVWSIKAQQDYSRAAERLQTVKKQYDAIINELETI